MSLRDDILNPIEGPSPAGPSLRYEPVYDQIREAAREFVPSHESEADLEKVPDWDTVISLASEAIAVRSKDLQLAAWLTEGLGRRQGFGALHEGLTLLLDLQETFWDDLHPEIDDGDLDFRAAPLHGLGGGVMNEQNPATEHFACRIRFTPSGLVYAEYASARLAGYDDDEENAEKQDRRAQLARMGRPTLEQWDQAAKAGNDQQRKEWYRALTRDLDHCLASLDRLEAFTDERYEPDRPSFRKFREALTLNRRLAGDYLNSALELAPDPIGMEEPDESPGQGDTAGASGAEDPSDGTLAAEPRDRKDAAARVAAVARFLRKESPTDPTPYLLARAQAWGPLRAQGRNLDPKLLEAPPTALRTRLRAFTLDGKWEQVLETGEEIMASPFGRGWLDLQRYTLDATAHLGPDYDAVADAIRGALRDLLLAVPDLPTLTLMDDSPVANAETRSWIRSQGLGRVPEADEDDAPTTIRAGAGRDVHQLALSRARAGQARKGIELLMREAAQERGNRARFLRRLQAAEIMLDHGLAAVARPILQEMVTRIEEHRLEEWESGETVALALALLYRCAQILGDDYGNAEELYLRVCRLDPMQAITLGVKHGGEE